MHRGVPVNEAATMDGFTHANKHQRTLKVLMRTRHCITSENPTVQFYYFDRR